MTGNRLPGGHHIYLLMNAIGLIGVRGIEGLTIVKGIHAKEGYTWTEVVTPSSPNIPPSIKSPMTVSCARLVASRLAKGLGGPNSSEIPMTLSTGLASIKFPLTLALVS